MKKLLQSKEDDKSCSTEEAKANKEINLQDCLKLFTKEETLAQTMNGIVQFEISTAFIFDTRVIRYCPQCKELKQATKKFDLWKLPQVLVIHLKRFSYDKYVPLT